MTRRPKTTKPRPVVKGIKSPIPQIPEKAEIARKDADPLYQEIRVENVLEREDSKKRRLKEGAYVEVTIEADAKETITKAQD